MPAEGQRCPVHIQPPKQLETAQLLTITCTGRPSLARMIQLLQPAVIARKAVLQHMMHRPWQVIVQQTACYDSLLAVLTTVLRKIDRSARDTGTIKPSVQMQMHHTYSSFVQKALLMCIGNGVIYLHIMPMKLSIMYPEKNVACMLQVTRGKQPRSKLRRNLCQDCSKCCKKRQQHSTPFGVARSCLEAQAFLHYLRCNSYSRVAPSEA